MNRTSLLTRRELVILALSAGVAACTGSQPIASQESIVLPTDLTEPQRRIMQDLQAWDAIVDHRTGTPGDKATASWLAEEIRKTGLKPELDLFPFTRRVPQDCSVTIGEQKIVGVPLFDGGLTSADAIRAKLGKPGDTGTIALTRFTPQASNPGTQAMLEARKQTENLGMVAVSESPDVAPGLALINADDYTRPYGLPVLQVATEFGPLLDQALANATDVEFICHTTTEETEASNVQVTIPGSDSQLAPLVIMTPRSAWWTCTSERGGGITIWLECLRYFAKHPPERTVIFTANTGHELGHLGLDHYLNNNESLVKDAHAWIHLGANFAAADGVVLIQASTPELMTLLKTNLADQKQVADHIVPTDRRPLGEARNIYDGGGHYVSLLGGNPLFHHPDDRWPDAIDIPRTLALTKSMLNTAIRLVAR